MYLLTSHSINLYNVCHSTTISYEALLHSMQCCNTMLYLILSAFSVGPDHSSFIYPSTYFVRGILEKCFTHWVSERSTSFCQSNSTVSVRTKCFSSRLIRGVGNFSYTVSFSAIRINLDKRQTVNECAEVGNRTHASLT